MYCTTMEDNISIISWEEKGVVNPVFVIEENCLSKDEDQEDIGTNTGKSNRFQKSEVVQEKYEPRQKWSNPIEFLLSCISMSVSFLFFR